jgi:hypothetical protein
MRLTSELLLEQFDQKAIRYANDTVKKKTLYNEFVNYIKSLHNPKSLEKILRFATGSIRVPLNRKIMVCI